MDIYQNIKALSNVPQIDCEDFETVDHVMLEELTKLNNELNSLKSDLSDSQHRQAESDLRNRKTSNWQYWLTTVISLIALVIASVSLYLTLA